MTTSVNTVELTIPPIIGSAMRCITSEPVPCAQSIGISPAMIAMGLSGSGIANGNDVATPVQPVACRQGLHPGTRQSRQRLEVEGCVVRRADHLIGRPLPGVLVMDGGPMPPAPPAADMSRAQEVLCGHLWSAAQLAAKQGVSLRQFIGSLLAFKSDAAA